MAAPIQNNSPSPRDSQGPATTPRLANWQVTVEKTKPIEIAKTPPTPRSPLGSPKTRYTHPTMDPGKYSVEGVAEVIIKTPPTLARTSLN